MTFSSKVQKVSLRNPQSPQKSQCVNMVPRSNQGGHPKLTGSVEG